MSSLTLDLPPRRRALTGIRDRRARPGAYRAGRLRDLVLRATAGEADAFGALYDHYVDLVYRYVYYRVGAHALAEDLTSETFLRALRRIEPVHLAGQGLRRLARHDRAQPRPRPLQVQPLPPGGLHTGPRWTTDRWEEGPERAVLDSLTNRALFTRRPRTGRRAAGVRRAALPPRPVGRRDRPGDGQEHRRHQGPPVPRRTLPGPNLPRRHPLTRAPASREGGPSRVSLVPCVDCGHGPKTTRTTSAPVRRPRQPRPSTCPPIIPDPSAAAFFDVDNTLIRGASIYHFARGLAATQALHLPRPGDCSRSARWRSACAARRTPSTSARRARRRWRSSRAAASTSWSASARRSTTRRWPTASGTAPARSPSSTSTPASRCGSSPPPRSSWPASSPTGSA